MSLFVNPYNFISLGGKCDKRESRETGKLTGVLSCTLTTKTPLFIPNTTNEHAFPQEDAKIAQAYNDNPDNKKEVSENDPKSYDFYSYDDLSSCSDRSNAYPSRPIIPGSSIRGVIRSAYEAATDSCLSTSDDDYFPLHKRSTLPYRKFGVVKGGTLYKAQKALLMPGNVTGFSRPGKNPPKSFERGSDVKPWEKVMVTLSGEDDTYITSEKPPRRPHDTKLQKVISVNKPVDNTAGYYLPSEPLGTSSDKHFDAVMISDLSKDAEVKELTTYDKERLKTLIRLYRENNPEAYRGFLDADNMPVYYEIIDDILYISPACISKEVLYRSVKSILDNQGGYAPCESSSKLCQACQLFGMVSEGDALASRVSFHDAVPVPVGADTDWKSWYGDVRTLAILDGPHVSATEFYMEDPGSKYDLFNYDYETTGKRKTKLADKQVKLRGRKFYWHSRSQECADPRVDNPKQLWTIRPVETGKTFSFDVAFERLTSEELSKLIWTLEIGGRTTHAHKLGHGKPIGYGSVQINVNMKKSVLWTLDEDLKICTKNISVSEWTPEGKWIEELIKITDFKNCPDNVSYPGGSIDGKARNYNWFVLNKEIRTKNAMNPRITNILPKIEKEAFPELPEYSKTGKGKEARYTPVGEKGNRGERR